MTLADLTVRDLMSTALITAKPHEAIDHADFDMKLANIRHIPVVDDRNRLVGIVSDRDVLRAFSKLGRKSVDVKSVMSRDVTTIPEDATAAEAVETLMKNKFGCLPVEGEDGQLVGLITETDFLRIAHRVLVGDTPEEIARALG